jgi:DNA (cytosine-5)-methyltransferase 1
MGKKSDIKPSAIDLFSGCGGLSHGLKKAGFNVVVAVELDETAKQTYQLNHPEVRLLNEDIRKIDAEKLRRSLKLKKGDLGLLAGCPPCQGFSRMRTKNGERAARDPRNALVEDFLRFVEAFLPKTIMMENVPALIRHQRFGALRARIKNLGYGDFVDVLDAANYGVPQRRRRLIFLASRIHKPMPAIPERKITVRQAIKSLQKIEGSRDALHRMPENRSAAVIELIKHIPKNGGSRLDLPERFHLECHKKSEGFFDVYGRMRWDDVAPTITSGCSNPSKGRFLHPIKNRTITLREAAVLQGFPRAYKFNTMHGKERIALMIGNALPPPFIAAHARLLRQAIKHNNPQGNASYGERSGGSKKGVKTASGRGST